VAVIGIKVSAFLLVANFGTTNIDHRLAKTLCQTRLIMAPRRTVARLE
jgi:hypothetical protein